MEDRLLANSARADYLLPQAEWGSYLYDGTFCWLWLGATKPANVLRYPTISARWKAGPRKGKVKTDGAHRVSLRVFRGRTLRKDYVARHLCNNSLCINPMHLSGGTRKQNTAGMMESGRHRSPWVKT